MRRQGLVLIGLCMSLACPIPLTACLWDSDTLATEARGMPEVVRVITGRFERNPPLYYEMRLERVSKDLERDPSQLELYDDAGVACDRLGRDDEAIGWMEKKVAELDKKEHTETETTEQRYRYHANLGTFLVHRWFKNGADRSKMEDLSAGREQIAKAIEINPDAHFGREKYQLKVIDWILKQPECDAKNSRPIPTFLDDMRPLGAYGTQEGGTDETIRGLTGLIALGNAWESVDVFSALTVALYESGRKTSFAFLSRLRAEELVEQGKSTLVSGAPKGTALKARLFSPLHDVPSASEERDLRTTYQTLRDEADQWQRERTNYMMARLKTGQTSRRFGRLLG